MEVGRATAGPFEPTPEWYRFGLCAQSDPDAFYPEQGGSSREAKRVCGRCEVKADCLEWALDRREQHGVWGGLNEEERRAILRRGGQRRTG